MTVVSMNYLLEAGVHFGHQTRRWNPKMKEYIFTAREDIYIIDLQKTVKKIEGAYRFVNQIASNGGKVLFVGTKKQAQGATREEAIRSNSYYVCERWLGGTLTNFRTIRKRVGRLEQIEKMEKEGLFELLPKKEVQALRKEYDKLNKYFCGIRDMKKLPDVLFIVDPRKEIIAIREARKLNIPVIGIVDTNCDPDDVDYVIPANDDAIRSVKLIMGVIANAIVEAQGGTLINFVSEEDKKHEANMEDIMSKVTTEVVKEVKETVPTNDVVEEPIVEKPAKKVKKTTKVKEEEPVEVEAKPKKTTKAKVEAETKPKKATKAKKEKVEVVIDYNALSLAELKKIAKDKKIKGYSKMKKEELINLLK